MKVKKAVIAAGGWGTRFLPLTKSQPKEMLPLVNKPLIQYSVEEAVACDMELVVIVTSSGKRAIEDHFDRFHELEQLLERKGEVKQAEEIRRLSDMIDITYIRQKEQLGLGHALLTARNIIGDEPFVLILPDDIFDMGTQVMRNMIALSQKYDGNVVAVQQVSESEVNRYGIIDYDNKVGRLYRIVDFVEKPAVEQAPSNLAIMGRYVLKPELFDILENTLPGKNGEIQLTDGLKELVNCCPVFGYEFEGKRYDVGTPSGWLQSNIALALQDPQLGGELESYINGLVASRVAANSRAI